MDFEKEMLVLHIFSTSTNVTYSRKGLIIEDGVLTVKAEEDIMPFQNASEPGPSGVLLRIKKDGINEVVFKRYYNSFYGGEEI